jgi:ferritin-like metal-binding protein YciE
MTNMTIKNPKELFVRLLSDVRQGTERTPELFQELSKVAEDSRVKEALEARAFVSQRILEKLDQCFKLIGEQPVKLSGRLQEVFAEDFRRELSEIESPVARHLYILAKANHLVHLRIGEYVALIAAADLAGHNGVGVLLESCLADKLAFVERTRRLIREIIEAKVAAKMAAWRRPCLNRRKTNMKALKENKQDLRRLRENVRSSRRGGNASSLALLQRPRRLVKFPPRYANFHRIFHHLPLKGSAILQPPKWTT